MMRAPALAMAILLSASPTLAQPVVCTFTLVCAPEIDCETHEGIPFEIAHEDGTYRFDVDGQTVIGAPMAEFDEGGLALGFATPGETMLFTLSPDDEGVLTRHRIGPGGRLSVASFIGPCARG